MSPNMLGHYRAIGVRIPLLLQPGLAYPKNSSDRDSLRLRDLTLFVRCVISNSPAAA